MDIDGKIHAKNLREKIKKEIIDLKEKLKKTPKLAVLLIGEYAPSKIYVKNKKKAAEEVGIISEVIVYKSDVTEKEILEKIKKLNFDESVNGILVQLPLPSQISNEKIINSIDPKKDVDGFNPYNVGRLSSGYDAIAPCTPMGCLMLIKEVEKKLSGKHVVIIGRSNLNGKPMAQLMLRENCTVTIVHSKTKNIKQECLKAEILIAAAGVPKLVKEDWIQKNCIVIDVGINKLDGKIVGDTDYDNIKNHVKAITPVPGGVGPMTIACLLQNTLACFKKSNY
jgi:methylenetetrahydrofolate dehydrogenase (NADP+)/methenyltetrahydrofolate cyclohydrolase